MTPELGQAIVAQADGEGPPLGAVQVYCTGTACANRIEFNPVFRERDAVASPRIHLSVVRPMLRSPEIPGTGLEMDAGMWLEGQDGFASFLVLLVVIVVSVLPHHAGSSLQIAVAVEIEVEVVNGVALDRLELGPLDVEHQGACSSGKSIIRNPLDNSRQPNSGQCTDNSKRDSELIQSESSFLVFHGSHLFVGRRYR